MNIITGISGLGRNFERHHCEEFDQSQFTLKYVFDPSDNLSTGSTAAIDKLGLSKTSRFDDLIEKLVQDQGALIINSPDNIHYKQTISAVQKGLPVFVEKPMGMTLSECKEIFTAVKQNNIPYISGLTRTQCIHFMTAKNLLDIVKEIRFDDMEGWHIEAGYFHDLTEVIKQGCVRGSDFHLYQNYFLGGAIHALSAVLYMTESTVATVNSLRASGKSSDLVGFDYTVPNPTVYDAEMILANGARLTLKTDVTPRSKGSVMDLITIRDQKGTVAMQIVGEGAFTIYGEQHIISDRMAFRRLYHHFHNAISKVSQPEVNGIDFTYHCTVPLLDALEIAGVERTDLHK